MERRSFIASVAGLAAGGAAAGASAGPVRGLATSGQKPRILVRTYLTGLTSDIAWRMASPKRGHALRLARAPDHRFDSHAVAARSETGDLLGYLPGIHARILAPLLDHGLALEARIVAISRTPRRAMHLDILIST